MPRPKSAQSATKSEIVSETPVPTPTLKSVGASPAEIAAHNGDVIAILAARTAEKDQLLEASRQASQQQPKSSAAPPVVAVGTSDGILSSLARYDQAARDAVKQRDSYDTQEGVEVADNLTVRVRSARTALGILKKKHAAHVESIAAFDFGAPATAERPGRGILGAVPFKITETVETIQQPNVLGVLESRTVYGTRSNHSLIGMLARTARELVEIFRSADGETETPVQAFAAVASNPYIDPVSAAYQLARQEAAQHVRRVETNLSAAETKLANLTKLEEQVQADLDGLAPLAVAPTRPVMVPLAAPAGSYGIVDSEGKPASGRTTGGDAR